MEVAKLKVTVLTNAMECVLEQIKVLAVSSWLVENTFKG